MLKLPTDPKLGDGGDGGVDDVGGLAEEEDDDDGDEHDGDLQLLPLHDARRAPRHHQVPLRERERHERET